MLRAVVSGDDPPDWVIAAAQGDGVELVRAGDAGSGSSVDGYVMHSFGAHEPEPVTAEVLSEMPHLRLVVYLGQSREPMDYAGFVDLDALRSAGIPLATTPAGDAVAEAAIGMLIAADLNLVAAVTDIRATIARRGLAGATLGIVGFGQIGGRVAELGAALGMAIRYVSRRAHPDAEDGLGAQCRSLDALCAEADFVSVHTANSAPAGLIGACLEHADGAVLINSASAPGLVDPESLLSALRSGRIRRAVVEGAYPDPWQDRLAELGAGRFVSLPLYSSWDTPQAHCAGWSQAIAALSALRDGQPIANRVV